MKDKIEVVAFDADDTLWENEVYFQEFEHQFCDLLKAYQPQSAVSQELFKTEMKNCALLPRRCASGPDLIIL